MIKTVTLLVMAIAIMVCLVGCSNNPVQPNFVPNDTLQPSSPVDLNNDLQAESLSAKISVTLLEPNGGEIWIKDGFPPFWKIEWTNPFFCKYPIPPNVRWRLTLISDSHHPFIIRDDLGVGPLYKTDQINWNPPDDLPSGSNYKVRVELITIYTGNERVASTSNPNPRDESDEPFTIKGQNE